jgi:heterodisulfide reductase subunit D
MREAGAPPRSTDGGGNGHRPEGLTEEFVSEWRDAAYGCFSSGHKFCREVCPVMQITRNENHSPTAFHANIVAMEKGHLGVEDVAEDYIHCVQCGACELRCPNTLFTGDFYRHRTRTIDVVKAMRSLAVEAGVEQPNWKRWVEATMAANNEPVIEGVSQERVRDWAEGLDLPTGGETILFVDCEAAFYRTSVARATAMVLLHAGVEFGLMREQWCCGGPAAEMGYQDHARTLAEHNLADWKAVGARRVITLDPHDYISFTLDYPSYFGDDYDIEVLHVTELVTELVRENRLELTRPVKRVVTYHDACRLNKRKGIYKSPREILRAIPGLEFKDVDHVTQWSYCSGAGGGMRIERPEIADEIARRRMERAAELEVDTLVSACVWSERPLSEQGAGRDRAIEVRDLMEIVADAAGLDYGGVR